MSDEIDFSLPEHPEDTKIRLKASGEWPEAYKLKQRRLAVVGREIGGGGSITPTESLRVHHSAWQTVQETYPPPDTASPCSAAAFKSWREEASYNHKSRFTAKVPKNVPGLKFEAKKRFDAIGTTTDLLSEVLWVYAEIDNQTVDPMTCPSRGAWSLLTQARTDREWFYQNHHKPAVAQTQKLAAQENDGEYKQSRAEKRAVADMEAMILEAVAESQA